MDDAIGADARAVANRDVRKDDRAVTHRRVLADGNERTNRHPGTERRSGGNRRLGVNAGGRPPGRREHPDRSRERQIWIARPEHRAGRRRSIVAEDHGRRAREAQRFLVLRIGEKGQIAGAGILNAGDGIDVDVTASVEATSKTVRQISQFHEGQC